MSAKGDEMIDRTTLDLRIAAHHAATARCNTGAWQEATIPTRRPLRRAVAALVAVAARLAAPAPTPTAHRPLAVGDVGERLTPWG